ncbi:MAG: hypothetical protein ACP5CD_01840 [Thermovirgaceae bacterium]
MAADTTSYEVKKEFALLGARIRTVFRPASLARDMEMCLVYPPSTDSREGTPLLEAGFEIIPDTKSPCGISEKETVSVMDRKLILDDKHTLPLVYRYGTRSKTLELEGLGCGVYNYETGKYRAFFNGGESSLPGRDFHRSYLFGSLFLYSLFMSAGIYSIHAACANVDGSGLVFTGDSGSGKSSSAFALMERGFPVLSDERILLGPQDGGYRAASLCDVVKVAESAVRRFFPLFLEKMAFHKSDEDLYFRMRDCGFAHLSETGVDGLCVLHQTGERESSWQKISPSGAVKHLFPVTINCDIPRLAKEKFFFLTDFLKMVPCYRIEFGTDMDGFTKVVREIGREAISWRK